MQSLTSVLGILKVIADSGVIEDFTDIAKRVWEQCTKNYSESEYSDETPDLISKTLHRMQTGSPPRIALVGMTSAGKSSLINALFGESISEVRRNADTTDCVLTAKFPSGLVIYDTPGLAGDEELGYENITRLFLDLQQEEDSTNFTSVPFQENLTEVRELSLEKLKQLQPLDAILFLVDISRTLNKYEKKALKSFFFELKDKYEGRVVVAGTHLDELNKLPEQEKQGQLDSYNKIFNAQLTPVSSVSGEGLSELVINLFHVMPQKVAPAKLQESLLFTKRLNRFAFTINESSNLLAEIILLKGNQANEIRAGYLWLFALICKHYSVDEDTWKKCNGDAFQISTEAKEAGVKTYKRVRHPQDFWEMIRAFLGHKFEQDVVEHERIGIKGLKQLLPGVYRLLYDLADVSGSRLSKEIIHQIVEAQAHKLEPLIEQNKLTELAAQVGKILQIAFPNGHSANVSAS
jgi:GTPase Era involved in 16S rRNA processing